MIISKADWPRLSELLDQALEMTEEGRTAWFAQLSSNDRALSEPLRKLLEQRARVETQDALDLPPDFAGALLAQAGRRDAFAHELTPNAIIGSYRLLRELGVGGMGAVWLAERIDGKFKRHVALKFPYAGPFQRQLAERIVRERDILGSLEHPNIARLYDADVTAAGAPFLVLEYVDGAPINEYCDRQQLTIRQRLGLFLQVLNAVQYAHARLVIHRDLKPSNILISHDGAAHLLDFGVAKLMPEGFAKETALTNFSGRALTPDYASPEQITGSVITTASDVYSLGVVLYELLVGTRPYRLKRESRASLEDAIAEADAIVPSRAVHDEARRLDAKIADKKRAAQLRGDLDAILLKALHKDVAARYATVDAFREDIERHLDGRSVLVKGANASYRLRKFLWRNRLAAMATAAVVIALAIGLGVAVWQAQDARLQRDRAFALSNQSEAINDFMDTVLVDAARTGAPMTARQILEQSGRLAEREFSHQPDNLAAVLTMLAVDYQTLDNWDKARPLMERALSLAKNSRDPELRGSIECDYAFQRANDGEVEQAEAQASRILGRRDIAASTAVTCLETLIFIAESQNDGPTVLKYASRALDLTRSSPNKSLPLEASLLGNMANGYRLLGQPSKAASYFHQAIEKFNDLGRERSRSALAVKSDLSALYIAIGSPLKALELYNEILAAAAADDPTLPPPIVMITNRARALTLIGRYKEATADFQQGLAAARVAGDDTVAVACLTGLANAARESGDIDAAERHLADADRLVGVTVPKSGAAYQLRNVAAGFIALSRERYAEARTAFTDAGAGSQSTNIVPWVGRARANLAEGNLQEASADAQRALALARSQQLDQPYSNRTGLAWLTVGHVFEQQHKLAEAHAAFKSAAENLEHTVDATHPALREAKQFSETTASSVKQ